MNKLSKVVMPRLSAPMSLVALSVISINSMLASTSVIAQDVKLDTLVVTGEKIDKTLQETTSAVTIVRGYDLDSGEVNQANDVAIQAPNVITDSSFSNVAIRGMSGGGAATGGGALLSGARPRVATVVDSSTQAWSGYNIAPNSLWDVEQVEILRGSQSTTQGSSAIGGAVVINTKDPSFTDEAAIRLGLEQYENDNIKHNIAVMSSGALVKDELAYRITADVTKGEGWINYETGSYDTPNLSESESLNLRGKLLWQPKNMPELSAKLTLNHRKNEGEHTGFVSNTDDGIATRTMDISSLTQTIARVQDSDENSFAVDVDYQIHSGLTNSFHIDRIDSDYYADGYWMSNQYNYRFDQKNTTLENRLIFDDTNSPLTGVLGLYVAQKKADIHAYQGFNIDTNFTTKTSALYGEGSYALTPKVTTTLGLRVEREDIKKTGAFFSSGDIEQNSDETYYLPKLGVSYKVTDTTILGASVRKGYSPGGSTIDTSGNVTYFDSEEVTGFELSSKSDFGAGTTLNVSVFYNNYSDYQAPSGINVVNVDKAHTKGLEVEGTKWLTDNLEIRGSIGLLDSKVDKYTSYEGNELSSSPQSNLQLGFTQYVGDALSFGADVTYVSEYYSSLDNSTSSAVGDGTLADVRLQYIIGDFTINGYVKNITDEKVVYYRTGTLATVGQSRTIGISALYQM